MTTTLIRNAELIVAWDESEKSHTYLPDADMAFTDGTLSFVGRNYEGPADQVIDGKGLMVMPGLVNIHSHPSSEPMNKGFLDEIGSPGLYNSSLYEYMPIFRADSEAIPHCVRVAISELLLSGVTTLADLSMAHPGWLDLLAESGMRVCVAPMFRSARWFTKNGHVVEYEWDEKRSGLWNAPSSMNPAGFLVWWCRRKLILVRRACSRIVARKPISAGFPGRFMRRNPLSNSMKLRAAMA